MFGIVGVTGHAAAGGQLLRMRDTLCHRGPDAGGHWQSPDGSVALGHRRLSIIDLSEAAAQPLVDPTGNVCIAYNGGLPNYRELARERETLGRSLRSASDTEVVSEANRVWGTDCLSHFVGMFDAARKQGFSLPLGDWYRRFWDGFSLKVLAEAPRSLFGRAEVGRLLAAQANGKLHMHRLFALTMFELWRREYGIIT